ncbi:MAG TPA: hypothetical protein VNA24_27345 [Hyalangium sp.]|nr:hypothetical protein [Hyalangium sp.]
MTTRRRKAHAAFPDHHTGRLALVLALDGFAYLGANGVVQQALLGLPEWGTGATIAGPMRSPAVASPRLWPLLTVLSLSAACDVYDRPNERVPQHFQSTMVADGSRLDASVLVGAPTVLALWVPK